MLLSFTAIDKSQELRDFCCYIPGLETALNLLDRIAAKGDTFLTIKCIDEGCCTELPCEAFDGEPVASAVQQLEQQWHTILDEPVGPTLPKNDWHVELTQQRVRLYEAKIDQYTAVINHLKQLRSEADIYIINEQRKANLLNRYDQMLYTYRQSLDQTTGKQKTLAEKLSRLQQNRNVFN